MYCFIGCVAYIFLKVMKFLLQNKLTPTEFNKLLMFILEIELNLGNTCTIDAFLHCNHPPHVNFNLMILDHISNWSSSKLDHVIKYVSLSLLHIENIPHLAPPVYWLNFVLVVVNVFVTLECIYLYILSIVPPMFIPGSVCNVLESCDAPMCLSGDSIM